MCFFKKKLKAKEVYDYCEKMMMNWNMAGYPKASERNAQNFSKPRNSFTKAMVSYTVWTKYDNLDLDYHCYYDVKKKEMSATVSFKDYAIVDQTAKKVIDGMFPKFTVNFWNKNTDLYKRPQKCESMADVEAFMKTWFDDFNASGAIQFFADLKRDQLKRR